VPRSESSLLDEPLMPPSLERPEEPLMPDELPLDPEALWLLPERLELLDESP